MLHLSLRRAFARLSLVAVTATAGAGLVAPPAHADVYTVSLTASKTSANLNESVTLTAYASADVGPTPYYISIFDTGTGAYVTSCGFGSVCSGTVSNIAGAHTYQAFVAGFPGSYPPSSIQATSNPVTVTWGLNSVCNSTSGVVACLAPTSEVTRVFVYDPTVVPGPTTLHVYGALDLYRFTVAGVTTTVPCVVTTGADPCGSLGGTFVSTVSTLVNTYENVPTVGLPDLTSVGVCNASLTLTVDGIGINAAPAITVC